MGKYTKWERFYQKLNMIFHGIIATSMIPFAWVFLETQKEFPEGPIIKGTEALIFNVFVIAVCAVLIGITRFSIKKSIRQTVQKEGIEERLNFYLKEKVKLYGILEVAGILALIGLYITKEHVYTAVYLVVLFTFSLQRPTFDRVSRETGISQNDLKGWGDESGKN